MAKRAVCVGIDEYAERLIPRLAGCCNDARAVAAALTQRFGFPEADVKLLLNDRASKEAILRALDWMLMTAAPGDVLVFYVASYGTVMPDRNAPGELDEVLVAFDHNFQFLQLRDDELADKLKRLPQGVLATCILDAGRLGPMAPPTGPTLYGSPLETHGRFLAPPTDHPTLAALRTRPLPLAPRLRSRRADDPAYLTVFACGEGEVARESSGGGAFTVAMLEALNNGQGLPWDEVVRLAGQRIQSFGGQQSPSCLVPHPLRSAPPFGGGGGGGAAVPTGGFGTPAAPAAQGFGPPAGPGAPGPGGTPNYGYIPTFGAPGAAPTPASGGSGMGLMAAGAAAMGVAAAGVAAVSHWGGGGQQAPAGMAPVNAPAVLVVGGGNPIDQALGQFSDSDATVRACQALFKVIPFAPAPIHYRSLGEALKALYPQADAAVAQRAMTLAASEDVASALKALSTVDTASTGIALFSGLKSAFGLLRGQGMDALETDTQQGRRRGPQADGDRLRGLPPLPGALAGSCPVLPYNPRGAAALDVLRLDGRGAAVRGQRRLGGREPAEQPDEPLRRRGLGEARGGGGGRRRGGGAGDPGLAAVAAGGRGAAGDALRQAGGGGGLPAPAGGPQRGRQGGGRGGDGARYAADLQVPRRPRRRRGLRAGRLPRDVTSPGSPAAG
jgi:hypothetical protein